MDLYYSIKRQRHATDTNGRSVISAANNKRNNKIYKYLYKKAREADQTCCAYNHDANEAKRFHFYFMICFCEYKK